MKHLAKLLVFGLVLGTTIVVAQRNSFRRGQGAVARNVKNRVQIAVKGKHRLIEGNGIPNHRVGRFPNRHNPNVILEQNHHFRVPTKPVKAKKVTRLFLGPFGIAVNGVLFDPGAAEFWKNSPRSGWQYEALSGKIDLGLDTNNAHVQPNGSYHYHGLPHGLIAKLGKDKQFCLLGYAADGFPIYNQYAFADAKDPQSTVKKVRSSYQVKNGNRSSGPRGRYDGTFVEDYKYVAGTGDLDECNGRFGVTPEYPEGTYYYCLTDEFPFIPRAFRGTPDSSFRRGPGRGGPPPRGRRGRTPRRRRPRR